MTVPTIISANVSPTHSGADSRGCIVGPQNPTTSKREPGPRARTIIRTDGLFVRLQPQLCKPAAQGLSREFVFGFFVDQ